MPNFRRQVQRQQLLTLGAKAAELLRLGHSMNEVATVLECPRSRLYRALYAAYPDGRWPDCAQPDPLLS